jgi:hypothetical protein
VHLILPNSLRKAEETSLSEQQVTEEEIAPEGGEASTSEETTVVACTGTSKEMERDAPRGNVQKEVYTSENKSIFVNLDSDEPSDT